MRPSAWSRRNELATAVPFANTGERLRAYYERAQHMRVADNRLAELIERLSKRLEEQKLQRE